jgi:phosphoribosylglycinamide formyltransferase-1
MTLQLCWFSTARGPGSRGMLTRVLKAIDTDVLDARIQFVFSNREQGEGEGSDAFFHLVERKGIPLITHSSRKFRQAHDGDFDAHRAEYDAEVWDLLAPHQPGLCVLAGYMLVLSPALCSNLTAINLHPALPNGPTGTWQEVVWWLIEDWAIESGSIVHLVTQELDQGPALSYARYSLRGWRFDDLWMAHGKRTMEDAKAEEGEAYPLFQAVRREGVQREPALLLETLKAMASGAIGICSREVVDAIGALAKPLDLTAQVEAALPGDSLLTGPA